MRKIAGQAVFLLVLTFFAGCGGGNDNDTRVQANPSITISPTTGTIKAGESAILDMLSAISWMRTAPIMGL